MICYLFNKYNDSMVQSEKGMILQKKTEWKIKNKVFSVQALRFRENQAWRVNETRGKPIFVENEALNKIKYIFG